MPNFFDYLLAPWKLFGLLGSMIASRPSGVPAPAGGGMCGYEDVGGQVLNVCHVLGYSMPAFVFWASTLILLLFCVASAMLVRQSLAVARGLGRAAAALERVPRPGAHGDQNQNLNAVTLALVRKALANERLTAVAWLRFEDSLLESGDATQGGGFYATEPVETAFSRALLIDQNVHGSLFASIPGILTGVGLLMTFVAILDGLSHVSVAANMDVQGIGGLINGLSGKFVSSIVAVTCAVSFVFIERIASAQPDRAYRLLVARLAPLFRRRTTEHLLLRIQEQLEKQGLLQRDLAVALGAVPPTTPTTPAHPPSNGPGHR